MIEFRRAEERQYQKRRMQQAWLTFYSRDRQQPPASGFGAIEIWREDRLAPRAGVRQPRRDAEIVTYVREGTLSYEDSTGQSGLIGAGEFQRMTVGPGIRYSEANASPTDWAHFFQIWLRPSGTQFELGHEQKHFSAAQRRGVLCLIASPDARDGSLRIHQDALLYSVILDRGQHVVHALGAGRGAWLHIVQGTVDLGTASMSTGDGAGITAERAVSLTASEDAEILLLDLCLPNGAGHEGDP